MGIDKINTNQIYNKPAVKGPETVAAAKPEVTEKAPAPAPKAPVRQTPAPAPKPVSRPVIKKKDNEPTVTERIEEQTRENLEHSKSVKNAIAEVNRKMNMKTRCEFSYHEDTKRVSIKVIDSETEEVIREIPPEETLDMLSKMWEVAGILIDEQR